MHVWRRRRKQVRRPHVTKRKHGARLIGDLAGNLPKGRMRAAHHKTSGNADRPKEGDSKERVGRSCKCHAL